MDLGPSFGELLLTDTDFILVFQLFDMPVDYLMKLVITLQKKNSQFHPQCFYYPPYVATI